MSQTLQMAEIVGLVFGMAVVIYLVVYWVVSEDARKESQGDQRNAQPLAQKDPPALPKPSGSCPVCGEDHARDILAAKNILRAAQGPAPGDSQT